MRTRRFFYGSATGVAVRSRRRPARFKIGTESLGDFRNITFTNAVIFHSRRLYRPPTAAISMSMVDGSTFENVLISNIVIRDAHTPLFLRLGNRGRGQKPATPGALRDRHGKPGRFPQHHVHERGDLPFATAVPAAHGGHLHVDGRRLDVRERADLQHRDPGCAHAAFSTARQPGSRSEDADARRASRSARKAWAISATSRSRTR